MRWTHPVDQASSRRPPAPFLPLAHPELTNLPTFVSVELSSVTLPYCIVLNSLLCLFDFVWCNFSLTVDTQTLQTLPRALDSCGHSLPHPQLAKLLPLPVGFNPHPSQPVLHPNYYSCSSCSCCRLSVWGWAHRARGQLRAPGKWRLPKEGGWVFRSPCGRWRL